MELKKNPKADLGRKRWMFFFIGTTLTLSLVLSAFEWKSYDDIMVMDLGELDDNFEDILDIPLTEQPPPPPPVIEQPVIKVVEDEVEVEDIDIEIDVDIDEETVITDIVFEEEPEEEKVDEIFTIVEDKPSFPGGDKEMFKFLNKNVDYPSKARRMGITGRVFVQFVVDRDGSVTDVKAIKGIGAGCDEEAVRAIKSMPKWKPGRQRGVPVKVKMTWPVYFKLN